MMKLPGKKIMGFILISFFILVTGSRLLGNSPESNGDEAPGFREKLVRIIDTVFERKSNSGPVPATLKVNPLRQEPWHDRVAMAKVHAKEKVPLVVDIFDEKPAERSMRLAFRLTPEDIPPEYNFFAIDSPLVNEDNDFYGPVRFMHKKHASITDDCTVCHHYRPNLRDASETVRCSACHQDSFNPEVPGRIGLKGAMHRQCLNCHRELQRGPTRCSSSCHERRVRDHRDMVVFDVNPGPTEVTAACLECHPAQGEDMLTSTHWLWRGPSQYTMNEENRTDLGKGTVTVNNFCVSVISNWSNCTGCHAGYGWRDENFDFSDVNRIDCLVCHDTTGTYRKDMRNGGMPEPSVDLVNVAKQVGMPSRQTCGNCHFSGGDEDFIRHGKLNPLLDFHGNSCDVHMGGVGFQCHDCHKTRNHKISGRSIALPVAEGSRSCEHCHTDAPHQEKSLLTHHLNRHCDHIACATCHQPTYAKCTPVKTFWNWSTAGDKNREVNRDEYGMPDYNWQAGDFTWGSEVKPVYEWYDGKVKRYLLGDTIRPDGVTILNEPVGNIRDMNSKIYPFKVMGGIQAADARYNYLLVPHLEGPDGYWELLDWQKSFEIGAKYAGLPYSGEYKWVETEMYLSLNHEVLPKVFSLSCVQCHGSLRDELSCGRCHQNKQNIDFDDLAYSGMDQKLIHTVNKSSRRQIDQTDWIDFEALGYEGDPIIYGGRFKKLPLGWQESTGTKK